MNFLGIRNWTTRNWVVAVLVVAFLVFLFVIPFLGISSGGFLPGKLNSPGTLQVLAFVFIIGALASSFDLVAGYAGLFSFGHALFFALGSYGFAMSMANTDNNFWQSIGVGLAATIIGAAVVNAIALRASNIAFSMMTLAFSQIAALIVARNMLGTGGDEGLTVPFQKMPPMFIGIINTKNIYWLALITVIVVFIIAKWLTTTKLGHTWQAVRENDLRVSVMGLNVYLYKFSASMAGSILAGICGIVYAITLGAADPSVTGLFYSLGLIVMLIIGGKGRVWGALIGGAIYTLLIQRLPTLAASDAVAGLPAWLKIPLSEPQLLLGVIFIIFIFAIPGGIASLIVKAINYKRPKKGGGDLSAAPAEAPPPDDLEDVVVPPGAVTT